MELEDTEEITYSISTVPRNTNYIDKTIAGSYTNKNFSIFVGMKDYRYVDKYRQQHSLYIMPSSEWEGIEDFSLSRRASYNYWRCLSMGRRTKGGLIVFEDDIQFALGWEKRFHKALVEAKKLFKDNFIITLYVHTPMIPRGYEFGNTYEIYDIDAFFGTQAVYFTDRTRIAFAEYLKRNAIDRPGLPYDMELRMFCHSTGAKIIATTPSLIQHVGLETTGLGGFHQAKQFFPVLPEAQE